VKILVTKDIKKEIKNINKDDFDGIDNDRND
jgi:hypothetical protein